MEYSTIIIFGQETSTATQGNPHKSETNKGHNQVNILKQKYIKHNNQSQKTDKAKQS